MAGTGIGERRVAASLLHFRIGALAGFQKLEAAFVCFLHLLHLVLHFEDLEVHGFRTRTQRICYRSGLPMPCAQRSAPGDAAAEAA